MESWLLFALAYPLLYAFVNVLDKFLLANRIKNYYSYAVITGGIWLTAAIIILLIVGFPQMTTKVLFFAILSGILYGLMAWVYYHMITHAEVSRVVGMAYLSVAVTAIFSYIFLKETLPMFKYVAILLAIIGTIILGIEKTPKKIRFNHVFKLLLLYVFIMGIIGVMEKYILNYITSWELFALLNIVTGIVLLLPVFRKQIREDLPNTAKNIIPIIIIQIISITAYAAYLKAASLQKISIIFSIGTLQPVYVFVVMLLLSIFTPHLLKEIITPKAIIQKIIGIGLVVAGVVVLSL